MEALTRAGHFVMKLFVVALVFPAFAIAQCLQVEGEGHATGEMS